MENYRGLYYQTLHENKLIGGYLSRYPSESLTSLNQIEREIENKNTTSLNSMFKNLEVDYIVVYKDYQTKKMRNGNKFSAYLILEGFMKTTSILFIK